MKTTVEKQVAAFEKLLGFCNAHGAQYNPSKPSMKVAALNSLLTSAQQSIQAVDTAHSELILAVNARQHAFNPLAKLGTRIVNALATTDATPELITDVKRIRDKFRFKAVSQPVEKVSQDSSQPSGTPADSSRGPLSQLDFETKIRNMGNLITLLASEPSYNPNETDLQVESLKTMLADLREKHKAVMNAQVALSTARLARKKTIYDANGVYGTGTRIKKYIRSVYGSNSEQFRQIEGLSFRRNA